MPPGGRSQAVLRCPIGHGLATSDPHPQFGFVLLGAVYTRTITITNTDPSRSLRLTVKPPRSSSLVNAGVPGVHHNKLRLFTRDLVKLAPGMSIYIDLVLFACEPAKFMDSFQINTEMGSVTMNVGAYILNQANWVCVSKRLWLEKRRPVCPGVACLGTIEHGKRKHLFTNEFPEETRPFGERHLRTTDRDHRPKRDRPIETVFPEEIEVSNVNGIVNLAPKVALLKQLRHEELEELRVIPCVKSVYWDMRKQRLSLATLLTSCPVDPDKGTEQHMAGVRSDQILECIRLEKKGFVTSRLMQALRDGEVSGLDGHTDDEEEEEEPADRRLPPTIIPQPQARAPSQGAHKGPSRLSRGSSYRSSGSAKTQPGKADPRKPSISPVNDVLSLSLLHQLASGGNMAAVQQAMGGGPSPSKHDEPPPSSAGAERPDSTGPREPSQGPHAHLDAEFGNEFFDDSPRFVTKPPIERPVEGTGKGGKRGPEPPPVSLTQPRPMSNYSGDDDWLSSDEWDGAKTDGPWLLNPR